VPVLPGTSAFEAVSATPAERQRPLPGDELLAADVQMDRAFDLPAQPEAVWPWLVQLGKGRGGWYLPWSVERYLPPSRRAVRRVVPELQVLEVGDTIPDWGGRHATLTLAARDPHRYLVHRSQRGAVGFTWALVTLPAGRGSTRVQSRVRLAHLRRPWVAEHLGGAFDLLTVAGLAHGLRERLSSERGALGA
jgi:hypothetical protein